MPVLQVLALVISLSIAAVGITLFVRAIRQILATLRIGQPAHRSDHLGARTATMVRETLGHTRMLQWTWVGAGHWFVMTGFGLLFFTLVTAFGQLFDPSFHLPVLGRFFLFEWATELFTWVMLVAIVAFIAYRATRPPERVRGPRGRFWGSTMWQGYFVELVILGVGVCIVALRGLEYALATYEDPDYASAFHFPLTFWLGEALSGISESGLANLIWVVATLKIVISFTWMIVISRRPSMGVAWHRFLAFFNIFFKRHASGRTSLGGLAPMTSGGRSIDFEDLDDIDEDTRLGVGSVEDFAWKGILDFSTCTECGRCQSQCPAWNTDKPLSPKLLITALRDHAYAKAPYAQASEGDRTALLEADPRLAVEAERPLVGDTGDDWFYMPDSGAAVIDPEVLWNCTSCGACVQQCPVDIEHVDHIVDMRRYQVLVESNFPSELNGLFKGLENKGNPWNMSPQARLDWAKDLPFEVKVVGEQVASLEEVEWLFWVGCAGAYEDRAKKTTRAVAELLDMAGVDFAVLGNGETCTGDPARRAGNEFVFQGLAAQNAEVLKETGATKVVSTCAHCFNTLKNEYAAFGVELEVVHHTQLLNRLVREKRLTPVATDGGAPRRSVTYHDPCYIGRHNGVYSPPRELLEIIPDADLVEMPRNSERSFCCGAGGARMWMEENTGERINLNRTKEAVETGADQIAVGCPFCRVMLSDGLTNQQSKGEAREEVEVLDVAQMLLASIKGETRAPVAATTAKVGSAGAAGAAAAVTAGDSDALQAEPASGDATQTTDTVTATEDVGPLAKASGGSSLFDDDTSDTATTGGSLFDTADTDDTAAVETPSSSSGSLFDVDDDAAAETTSSSGDSLFDVGDEDPTPTTDTAASETTSPGGGSLFDVGDDADTEATTSGSLFDVGDDASAEATSSGSLFDVGDDASAEATSSGSLFDVGDEEGPTATAQASAEAEQTPPASVGGTTTTTSTTTATPATEIPDGGSLFDLEAEETEAAAAPAPDSPTEPRTDETAETVDRAEDAEVAADQDQPEPGPTGPIRSLKEIKAQFAEDGESPTEDPTDAANDESEAALIAVPEPSDAGDAGAEAEEPSGEASSGNSHRPRTDADVHDAASLFDL